MKMIVVHARKKIVDRVDSEATVTTTANRTAKRDLRTESKLGPTWYREWMAALQQRVER